MSDTPLALISLGTMLAGPPPPVSWLVEPLISEGSRVVVYGEWGSYKSWGLIDLGLHIAAGEAWLGKFPIPRARRVLYVDEEMSPRLLHRRVARLATGMGRRPDPAAFQALSRQGIRFDAGGVGTLLADLARAGFEPDVVIVETFRRVLVGNENDAETVATFWRSVDPVVRAGKTLIVSHHMRKFSAVGGGNRVKDRASGSTDILGGADDALAFERRAQDAFIVEHVKCRDGAEAEPFAVSFFEEDKDSPVMLRFEGTRAEFQAQAGRVALAGHLIEEFLASAPGREARTEALLAHLASEGISERTGQRALGDLKRRGRLASPQRGVYRLVSSVEGNRQPPPPSIHDGDGGSPPPSPPFRHPPAPQPAMAAEEQPAANEAASGLAHEADKRALREIGQ